MRFPALCAAALLCLLSPPGCSLLPDDGSGVIDNGGCTGGPVALSIPAVVFCDVVRIEGSVTGPGMAPLDVTIDRTTPAATLTIPSGPQRQLVVTVYTEDNAAAPAFTSTPYLFCVSEGQPVSVSVDVATLNRNPEVGAIASSASGTLLPGKSVTLTVSAQDPDACDGVKDYRWTATSGTIAGSGATVVWTPWCSTTFWKCDATVEVTVQDGRGGSSSVQATYTISPPT